MAPVTRYVLEEYNLGDELSILSRNYERIIDRLGRPKPIINIAGFITNDFYYE